MGHLLRAVDPLWREILENALRISSDTDQGLCLFHEEREDMTVELQVPGAGFSAKRSRVCGLSARGADAARLVRSVSKSPASWPPGEPDAEPQGIPVLLSLRDASGLLERLVQRTLREQPAAAVRARWVGFSQRVHVGRPGRPVAADQRRGARVRLEARLEKRGRQGLAVAEASILGCGDDLTDAEQKLAALAGSRVEQSLDRRPVKPGETTLVFAPGVGGILIHEIVGHAVEADVVLAGRSWLSGVRPGEVVGSAELQILDDPRRGRAGWRVDDEGEPARPTPLVSRGRLAGLLIDNACGRRYGRPPTGHGRRSSYRDPVRPRMGCTFMASGRLDAAGALEGLSDGIYVRRMEAASVDALSGRALFRITDADRIEGSRLGSALEPHMVSLDAKTSLATLECISNDLMFDTCIGSCVRDGQPLATSVGAPTFRIRLARVFS